MNILRRIHIHQRLPAFVTRFTILAFVTLVFLGIFDCANPIMTAQMTMDGPHHSMADCIPGKNCGMDMSEHLSIWEGMITTNLPAFSVSFFATLLVVAFLFGIGKIFSSPQTSSLTARYLYYDRDHRESKLYNYFVSIFATGILQPKLFA